jgi:hypothetical protein
MSDDVTITVRVNNQTLAGFRDINGQLRTLDGRFAAMGDNVRRTSSAMERGMVDLRATMLSLAPALVPVASSLAPIAVQAGAAGLAVGAFTAAVIPQIKSFKDVSDAQAKYAAQAGKTGAASAQALKAQEAYTATLSTMPAQTVKAAIAFQVLGDKYKSWSDSLAKFTMAPVEKSFAVVGALLPKFTPMAQGAATQLDRLVTIAGGAVNTSGFDSLSKKVSDFANQSLKNATDGAVHLIRVLSEGGSSGGGIASFMAYAHEQGPAVKDTLVNLAKAIGNILQGAAQAGPGLLSLVNAFAKLVAAAPPQLIGTLMSVYSAIKLIGLAGVGLSAVGGGVQSLATKIFALQAASAAAGGGVAGLKAAFLSLGTAAKATVVVAGITLIAVALMKLSDIGKKAPPDVDRLTTSLSNLGSTGKVSGEALRAYGKDLGGLADSLRTLSRPSNLDKTQQFLTSLVGMDSTPVKKAKEDLDGVDKALANMVKGGKADLAKVAFDDIAKAMQKQGLSSQELKSKLKDYNSALADQALEQKLAAQSMGLFGQQAQDVQAKLDAQKASADGLRQSIQALNDVNRKGLGGMIGFEAAIDAAAQAARDNAGALSETNGVLNLGSEKARAAASALQDLADKTDAAASSARESGSNWETVNGIYERGRSKLVEYAQAMGLSQAQASALADQILRIPDKTAKIRMNAEDATRDLENFNALVRRSPGSKSVTLKTLSGAAEQVLNAFGYHVTHLKDGSVKITAQTGGALSAINNVQGAVNSLHGKTIGIGIYKTEYLNTVHRGPSVPGVTPYATGGLVRGYAGGGQLQHFDEGGYIQGPGTPTSDSILATFASGRAARVSDSEYVVQASAVRKYGVRLLDALNQGRLKLAGFAGGGLTQDQRDARNQISGNLGVSLYGRYAGYSLTPTEKALSQPTDLNSLVQALNELHGQIRAGFRGRQQASLLAQLGSAARGLINYDKSLYKVTQSLDAAKSKLDDLKSSASQLSDSVKNNVLSSANITKGAGNGPVSVASIMGGLTTSRDKATAFADALKKLGAKGLDKSLIQQIAEAGIEGGGLETAGALLGASKSEIASMNGLQGQIAKAAGAAGQGAADAVYGAAIKAQQKLVNSLTASQSRLEKAMLALSRSLEKTLARATGKAAGGIVGAAASGGVRGGLTWVGEHEPELLELPAGSRVWSGPDSRRMAQAPWASMLTTHRGRAATAARLAAPASDRPIVIHLSLAGRDIGEIIIDPLRKSIHHRGGDVQAVLGKG